MIRSKNNRSPADIAATRLQVTLLAATLALVGGPVRAEDLGRQAGQDEPTKPSVAPERRQRTETAGRFRIRSNAGDDAAGVDTGAVLPGTVTERVVPRGTPDQVYALYVPSRYSPRSPAPVLYLLDARGRAMVPLERFRPAADRLGWILASSWTSASDGPFKPNLDALRAIWKDTHERLVVAEGRAYAAGFSGTARAAVTLAMLAPGSLAGVIASGAGFPPGTDPAADLGFAYFAAVGTTDFNYWEVLDLDEELDEPGAVHRVVVFDGGHQWMPAEEATAALEWMELQALRSERSGASSEVIAGAWRGRWERARTLEEEGDTWRAWRRYESMVEDFAGLRDVEPAKVGAARLAGDPDLEVERELRARLRREEEKALERAERILGEALALEDREGLQPDRTAARLRLAEWLERSAGEGARGEAATRVVAKLRVQLGFYLPREAEAQGRQDRAAFFLELAGRLNPNVEKPDAPPS